MAKKGFDVGKDGPRHLDSKGVPKHSVSGAPGAPNTGTPGYLRQAVSSAESHARNVGGINRSEHRISSDWKAGPPSTIRGGSVTRKEVTKPGQAG